MFSQNDVAKSEVYDSYNGSDSLDSGYNTTGEGTFVNPFENIKFGSNGDSAWVGISFILAAVISLVVFFLFVKSGKQFANKFVAWLKEFLNFRSILIENILKYLYLFSTLFLTFVSFALIKESFLAFLLVLVLGNVFIRLVFEGILTLIMIWKNTSDIAKVANKINNPSVSKRGVIEDVPRHENVEGE